MLSHHQFLFIYSLVISYSKIISVITVILARTPRTAVVTLVAMMAVILALVMTAKWIQSQAEDPGQFEFLYPHLLDLKLHCHNFLLQASYINLRWCFHLI